MDLISSRTIDITKLAMDGLMDRQQAISSNIANVVTPGYQRKEVAFESQLAKIIEGEDLKDHIKGQNSIEYVPPNVDVFTGEVHRYRTPTLQEKAYLQANIFDEFKPQYVMTAEELPAAKAKFNNAISNILSKMDNGLSDYEKELYLHDKLASIVTYEDGANSHNAYGALVDGKAVCEGYAEALQCLLQACGVQSVIVLGSSVNPSTNQAEGHAWNMVRIDGKYYHTDLTWNDQENTLFHAYFNLDDNTINLDHTVQATEFEMPECNFGAAHYFVVNNLIITDYSNEIDVTTLVGFGAESRKLDILKQGDTYVVYLPAFDENHSIFIYSIDGKLITSVPVNSNIVDIPRLQSKRVYILKYASNEKLKAKTKVIKLYYE